MGCASFVMVKCATVMSISLSLMCKSLVWSSLTSMLMVSPFFNVNSWGVLSTLLVTVRGVRESTLSVCFSLRTLKTTASAFCKANVAVCVVIVAICAAC